MNQIPNIEGTPRKDFGFAPKYPDGLPNIEEGKSDCELYEHIPEPYDVAFWHCKVCGKELYFDTIESLTKTQSDTVDRTTELLTLHLPSLDKSVIRDTISVALHHQLQKARAEGYEQGYTQGKFDEKMDAEYKHPEELQKAREEEKSRILKLALTMGDCPINNPEAGAGWMKFQHDFCLKLTKDNKETILSENDHSELDQDNK